MGRLFKSFSGIHGFALAILIIASLSISFFNERDPGKYPMKQATSYIEGLRIIHRTKGEASWTIMAKRADFTRDERTAKMDSVVIDIQKEGITLNAEKGVFDLETKDLKLEDNITLKSKGYEMALRDLSWDPAKGLLRSDQKIELKGKNFSIVGDGLFATEKQQLRLHRNVKAIFY